MANPMDDAYERWLSEVAQSLALGVRQVEIARERAADLADIARWCCWPSCWRDGCPFIVHDRARLRPPDHRH